MRIDRQIGRLFHDVPPYALTTPPIRLTLLGTSTVDHLVPAIRVALLRRGLWGTVYVAPYGMFQQELLNPASGLHRFAPTNVLFCQDSNNLSAALDNALEPEQVRVGLADAVNEMRGLWKQARERLKAKVLQQTSMPRQLPLMGRSADHRQQSCLEGYEEK
jgi:predicted enzyme involved in methoxymalonyl-ACP biosynthesis